MLNRTLLETLQKAGFSKKFLDEMIAPVNRVNYGQSMDINGFVGEPRLGKVRELVHGGVYLTLWFLTSDLSQELEKTTFLCETSDIVGTIVSV